MEPAASRPVPPASAALGCGRAPPCAPRRAWLRFTSKWKQLCPAVVESLEEAGAELLTFYRLPESQWKGLRTTNIVERVIEEFRRRVKTQGC